MLEESGVVSFWIPILNQVQDDNVACELLVTGLAISPSPQPSPTGRGA
jgi:hypothetical protein